MGGHGKRDRAAPQACRACVACGRTETPQWREGPLGPKTLCNACGVKHLRAKKHHPHHQVAASDQRATPRAQHAAPSVSGGDAEQQPARQSRQQRTVKKPRLPGSPTSPSTTTGSPGPSSTALAVSNTFLPGVPAIMVSLPTNQLPHLALPHLPASSRAQQQRPDSANTSRAAVGSGVSAATRQPHHSPASTTATNEVVLLGPATMFQARQQQEEEADWRVAQELLDFACLAAGSSSCAASDMSEPEEELEGHRGQNAAVTATAGEAAPPPGGAVMQPLLAPAPALAMVGAEVKPAPQRTHSSPPGAGQPQVQHVEVQPSTAMLDGSPDVLQAALEAVLPLLSQAERRDLESQQAAFHAALEQAQQAEQARLMAQLDMARAQAQAEEARRQLQQEARALAWLLPASVPALPTGPTPAASAALPGPRAPPPLPGTAGAMGACAAALSSLPTLTQLLPLLLAAAGAAGGLSTPAPV